MEFKLSSGFRKYEDMSRRDVFLAVAADHALAPDVWEDGAGSFSWFQTNESDYDFARRLAVDADCEMWVDDDTFYVQPVGSRQDDPLALDAATDVDRFSIGTDLTGQRLSAWVDVWDVEAAEVIAGSSDAAGVGDYGGGVWSASDIMTELNLPGSNRTRVSVIDTVPFDEDTAGASARARFAAMARRFVTLSASMAGDARVRVGATLEMSNLGPEFDGTYLVHSTTHRFDRQKGYTVQFTAHRAAYGGKRTK